MKYLLFILALALPVSVVAGEKAEVKAEAEEVAAEVCEDCDCSGLVAKVAKAPLKLVGNTAQGIKERRALKAEAVEAVEVTVEETVSDEVAEDKSRRIWGLRNRVKVKKVTKCCK